MSDIYAVLDATTRVFRKGPEVIERPGVVEVYAYPHYEGPEASGFQLVDVHFVVVGVNTDAAMAAKADLLHWLRRYPQQDRLAGGPSYIEFAAAAEVEQETAFRIFALGKVLGLWDVVTPAVLGVTGPEADALAGSGLVMIAPKAGAFTAA